MDVLWAPWRMQYISQHNTEKEKSRCIFCAKPAEKDDKKNLIIHRSKTCFVIMNLYPYNNGHLMVVPFRHTANLYELTDEENLEIMKLMSKSITVLRDTISPHGFNIGMNLGRVAGAGVEDHLHFHIVPRWEGDTNFMPITAHTKVVAEALEETWGKLKEVFEKHS